MLLRYHVYYGSEIFHSATWYILGAKSCNVSLRLTQKVAKVCVVIITRKYPKDMIRVGAELQCGSKVPEMRDALGYPRAQILYFLKEKVIQNSKVLNNI